MEVIKAGHLKPKFSIALHQWECDEIRSYFCENCDIHLRNLCTAQNTKSGSIVCNPLYAHCESLGKVGKELKGVICRI